MTAILKPDVKLVVFPACIQGKCGFCESILQGTGTEYRCNCPCHSDSGGLK